MPLMDGRSSAASCLNLSVPQFLPPHCGGEGLLRATAHTHCSQLSPAGGSRFQARAPLRERQQGAGIWPPPQQGATGGGTTHPWGPHWWLTGEARTQALGSDFWARNCHPDAAKLLPPSVSPSVKWEHSGRPPPRDAVWLKSGRSARRHRVRVGTFGVRRCHPPGRQLTPPLRAQDTAALSTAATLPGLAPPPPPAPGAFVTPPSSPCTPRPGPHGAAASAQAPPRGKLRRGRRSAGEGATAGRPLCSPGVAVIPVSRGGSGRRRRRLLGGCGAGAGSARGHGDWEGAGQGGGKPGSARRRSLVAPTAGHGTGTVQGPGHPAPVLHTHSYSRATPTYPQHPAPHVPPPYVRTPKAPTYTTICAGGPPPRRVPHTDHCPCPVPVHITCRIHSNHSVLSCDVPRRNTRVQIARLSLPHPPPGQIAQVGILGRLLG